MENIPLSKIKSPKTKILLQVISWLELEEKQNLNSIIFSANLSVQVSNLFNKNYYNHTSFYCALKLPEQAETYKLWLGIPFGK